MGGKFILLFLYFLSGLYFNEVLRSPGSVLQVTSKVGWVKYMYLENGGKEAAGGVSDPDAAVRARRDATTPPATGKI